MRCKPLIFMLWADWNNKELSEGVLHVTFAKPMKRPRQRRRLWELGMRSTNQSSSFLPPRSIARVLLLLMLIHTHLRRLGVWLHAAGRNEGRRIAWQCGTVNGTYGHCGIHGMTRTGAYAGVMRVLLLVARRRMPHESREHRRCRPSSGIWHLASGVLENECPGNGESPGINSPGGESRCLPPFCLYHRIVLSPSCHCPL